MADEEKKALDPQAEEENLDYKDYIQAIKDLKENSVPKDEYNKVVEEKKELIKSLMDGDTINMEDPTEKVDIHKLRLELYSGNESLSNLEYAKKTLQLRDALIANGKEDPFLPSGTLIHPTQEDKDKAERVAEGLRHCIDFAEGDSGLFTNELQRIMVDSQPKWANRRR